MLPFRQVEATRERAGDMIRANKQLEKAIQDGTCKPWELMANRCDPDKKEEVCELPKAPEYQDPADHEHERHE